MPGQAIPRMQDANFTSENPWMHKGNMGNKYRVSQYFQRKTLYSFMAKQGINGISLKHMENLH